MEVLRECFPTNMFFRRVKCMFALRNCVCRHFVCAFYVCGLCLTCRVNHLNERRTKINTADDGCSRTPEKMNSTALNLGSVGVMHFNIAPLHDC